MMKTATTAVQEAAASQRRALLASGVRYPGLRPNQSEAFSAVLGRRGQSLGAERQRTEWDRLLAECAAHPSDRRFVSSELVAGAKPVAIDRIIESFGPDLHIVVTVRSLAELLPSGWQQRIKQQGKATLEAWLERVVDEGRETLKPRARGIYGVAGAIGPWVRRLGADRVTVVALDKARPRLVFDAFESLAGLPAGVLRPRDGAELANRGLSYEEAELLRAVNRRVRDAGLSLREYQVLVRAALVDGLQETRLPGPDERRITLPSRFHGPVAAIARRQVARTQNLGVNIVGDLSGYATEPEGPGPGEDASHVPASLVDDAVTCVRQARRWGVRIGPSGNRDVTRRTSSSSPSMEIGHAADLVVSEILRPSLRRSIAQHETWGRAAREWSDAARRVAGRGR